MNLVIGEPSHSVDSTQAADSPASGQARTGKRPGVAYRLGQDTSKFSRDELREIVDGLVRRVQKLAKDLEHARHRTGKKRKRKGRNLPRTKPPSEPTFRKPPDAEQVTEQEEAHAEGGCPHCGGVLEHEAWEDTWVSDIPPVKPTIKQVRIEVCRCKGCRATVRGAHPDVAPDQHGATAHRVGDRAMALAHWLHYDLRVPQRKVPIVLKELAGLEITQGALAQDASKRAQQLEADYQAEREQVRQSPVAHTDDTGWRVGGKNAQLMVFATERTEQQKPTTVYQIRERHRNDEVREVLPEDWDGVMVTDRGKSYDAKRLTGVEQQKCHFHILQSVDKVLETVPAGEGATFCTELKELSQRSIALWHEHKAGEISRARYLERGAALLAEADVLLRVRSLGQVDAQRLLDQLRVHHERGNVFRFLTDPSIPPTNNLAERELRPEVIGRKVSGGSKNWKGARTRERLTTIVRTERRRNPDSIVEAIHERFRGARRRAQRSPPPPARPNDKPSQQT